MMLCLPAHFKPVILFHLPDAISEKYIVLACHSACPSMLPESSPFCFRRCPFLISRCFGLKICRSRWNGFFQFHLFVGFSDDVEQPNHWFAIGSWNAISRDSRVWKILFETFFGGHRADLYAQQTPESSPLKNSSSSASPCAAGFPLSVPTLDIPPFQTESSRRFANSSIWFRDIKFLLSRLKFGNRQAFYLKVSYLSLCRTAAPFFLNRKSRGNRTFVSYIDITSEQEMRRNTHLAIQGQHVELVKRLALTARDSQSSLFPADHLTHKII